MFTGGSSRRFLRVVARVAATHAAVGWSAAAAATFSLATGKPTTTKSRNSRRNGNISFRPRVFAAGIKLPAYGAAAPRNLVR